MYVDHVFPVEMTSSSTVDDQDVMFASFSYQSAETLEAFVRNLIH